MFVCLFSFLGEGGGGGGFGGRGQLALFPVATFQPLTTWAAKRKTL